MYRTGYLPLFAVLDTLFSRKVEVEGGANHASYGGVLIPGAGGSW